MAQPEKTRRTFGRRSRRFRDPEGAAYLIAVISMVVLVLIGLTLAYTTQTERLLGANERVIQRIFYAADSGTAAATARSLALNNHEEMTLLVNEETLDDGTELIERVNTSRFHPILTSPCDYCEINQGTSFFNVNHAVTATAERVGWSGGGPPPADAPVVARKTVAQMVAFQPWQVSIHRDILPSLGENQLDKIKF